MKQRPDDSPARTGGVRPRMAGLVAALAMTLSAQPAMAQISGEVIDASTRSPVAAATVTLVGEDGAVRGQAVTGSDGTFSITPGADRADLEIQIVAFGYSGLQSERIVYEGTPVHRVFELTAQPLLLDGLRVDVESQDIGLRLFGFYERKARGYGHFIDEDQIRATEEPGVTGVLRGAPSLFIRGGREVLSLRNGGRQRGDARFCRPTVFVDGSLQPWLQDQQTSNFSNVGSGRTFNDWLPPKEDLIGVEVYRSLASLPRWYQIEAERFMPRTRARLSEPASRCGAILIWTRLESRADASER